MVLEFVQRILEKGWGRILTGTALALFSGLGDSFQHGQSFTNQSANFIGVNMAAGEASDSLDLSSNSFLEANAIITWPFDLNSILSDSVEVTFSQYPSFSLPTTESDSEEADSSDVTVFLLPSQDAPSQLNVPESEGIKYVLSDDGNVSLSVAYSEGAEEHSSTIDTEALASPETNTQTDPQSLLGDASQEITRDPLKWPFARDSIWNTPIGSNAQYIDAQIGEAENLTVDVDYFYVLDANDPLRPLYAPGNWGPGRSTGTDFQNIALPIANDFLIEDATDRSTPNNAAAFLLPDGRTVVQLNPLTRDRFGGPLSGWQAATVDLYGDGIQGGHGGSDLSSIGGTVRLGELIGDEPIRHTLKVNLFGEKYFAYTEGPNGGLGYRWPATRADSYADAITYGGQVPELTMGALLAIPPGATPESLGIQTEAGRKLFYAFQDYGAYVADNTRWDAHAIAVENGVLEEFEAFYAEGDTVDLFYDDYAKLFSSLHVVDNNGPDNIGGGGTPRAPLAPDFATDADQLNDVLELSDEAGPAAISGNDDRNTFIGNSDDNLLDGQGNHDYLTGGDGNDVLQGGEGNDYLFGEGDRDFLTGGPGNDYLDGGDRGDTLHGGSGDDFLSGWFGNDELVGGSGYDTLVESQDNDFLLTNFSLTGKGTDTLNSIERVILSGGDSDNILDASAFTAGKVNLHGGVGNDVLIGGTQNDTLVSSSGQDTLTGGNGGDKFQLNSRVRFILSNRFNPYESGEYALITDFNKSEDIIKLEGSAEQFVLEPVFVNGVSGTMIYVDIDANGSVNTGDEVVAAVQGISVLDLEESYFNYL